MKTKAWLTLASLGLLSLAGFALARSGGDVLPRRGYFGVGLEKAENGARVFSVAPNSTAAAEQIVVGDVIEAIDNHPAASPEAVVALIGRHKAGESVEIELRRDGNARKINAILKPFPLRRLERLPGGLGVMADDVGAGIYALIVLTLIQKVFGA